MHLPYSNIFPYTKNTYLDLTIEGVGTKVLLAQLAEKYDTIGVDAVAMAVNDVIRSGATPLAISDNIHAQASNPKLVKEWLEGIAKGADESECPVVSGEIGDVAEIIKGLTEGAGFDMVVAAIGQVAKPDIITGKSIKAGDAIIGLRSSGLHSNGITLARKILFKQWGGKYEPHAVPDGLNREIGLEDAGAYQNLRETLPQSGRSSESESSRAHNRRRLPKIQQPHAFLAGHRLRIQQLQTATHLRFNPENRAGTWLNHNG